MTTLLKFASLILLSLAPLFTNAQKNYLKDADKAFKTGKYNEAMDLYKKSYGGKTDKKAYCLFKLGECNRHLCDFATAETYYIKAIKAKYPEPNCWYYLAQVQKSQAKYEEAIFSYKEYNKLISINDPNDHFIISCELAKQWIEEYNCWLEEYNKRVALFYSQRGK